MKLVPRPTHTAAAQALTEAGEHPLLSQLFASRGVSDAMDLDLSLKHLIPPSHLKGNEQAGQLLADAIESQKQICIVADYDCDGATACAVALSGLELLGAKNVHFLVPDRVHDGYGLTPKISQRRNCTCFSMVLAVLMGMSSSAM